MRHAVRYVNPCDFAHTLNFIRTFYHITVFNDTYYSPADNPGCRKMFRVYVQGGMVLRVVA